MKLGSPNFLFAIPPNKTIQRYLSKTSKGCKLKKFVYFLPFCLFLLSWKLRSLQMKHKALTHLHLYFIQHISHSAYREEYTWKIRWLDSDTARICAAACWLISKRYINVERYFHLAGVNFGISWEPVRDKFEGKEIRRSY